MRHGQQDYPKDMARATTADWVDPPLSDLGDRQADAVGQSMIDEPIAAVYASNLERAHETGRQIARHHGLEVTVLPEREIELFRDLPEGTQLTDAVDPILLRGARERWVQDRRGTSTPTARPATSSATRCSWPSRASSPPTPASGWSWPATAG